MIKTKLLVTVGPACNDQATLAAMIDAGVDVFRLNFSHGTLDSHQKALKIIRRIARDRGTVVAVMGDLCGPKIRIGKIAGGQCELVAGQQVVFQRADILGSSERLSSNYESLVDDVKIGHRLLIDDGKVLLRAIEKRSDELVCWCEIGGPVSDRKGINLPDSSVSAPALNPKDLADLEWAIKNNLDYIALSFVRRPEDIKELRNILEEHNSKIRIVAKIEKPEAIVRLEEIISQSDVVLVARGDLGVEMDVSRVPIVQKEIALQCQRAGKPVIIATQILQSMVNSPVPTRAEVSDVANAILDRADGIMLSAETSIGKYPLEAVRVINKIAMETETFGERYSDELGTDRIPRLRIATAVVHGVSLVAGDLGVRLVAVWTDSGDPERLLSKHRMEQPIVALTADEIVCRQMALLYGVIPIRMEPANELNQMLGDLDKVLIDNQLADVDDQIVLVADSRPDLPGETDAMFIHQVGSSKDAVRLASDTDPAP
ncbi:MAG: pyruvate kinase [Planctomycetota bacterium]|nr:MAG: pyruvate kinase [Planctomycetota bacterium]